MDKKANRQLSARLARQFYANEITYEELVDDFPEDTNDSDIDKLFDLIEHQPKRGGLLGATQTYYDNYTADILAFIEKLEK